MATESAATVNAVTEDRGSRHSVSINRLPNNRVNPPTGVTEVESATAYSPAAGYAERYTDKY